MYTPKKPNFIIATIPLLSLIFMAFMSTVYWGIGMLCFVNFFRPKERRKSSQASMVSSRVSSASDTGNVPTRAGLRMGICPQP